MDNIEKIIDMFIEPYKQDKNIQAAILTGSYAMGNQNKHSDIDIFIVSSDELNWRERGNKIIMGYMIEYFINPTRMIMHEMENQNKTNDRVTAIMIANGKKIFDKSGILTKLTEKSLEILQKPLNPIDNTTKERAKYFTHYYHDQLTRAYETNSNEFMYLYYTFLEHIIYSYGAYTGIILSPRTKIYQYISDEEYKMNRYLKKIEDKMFIKLLNKCMQQNEHKIMYENISELKKYLQEIMGGFNINGWKMRTEIDI
jgi:predicted nucleotidyltransferase